MSSIECEHIIIEPSAGDDRDLDVRKCLYPRALAYNDVIILSHDKIQRRR